MTDYSPDLIPKTEAETSIVTYNIKYPNGQALEDLERSFPMLDSVSFVSTVIQNFGK